MKFKAQATITVIKKEDKEKEAKKDEEKSKCN